MAETAPSKSERINLRLDPSAKSRLERAAVFEGKTVSGFVLASALASADRAIREHETMVLGERDAQGFFDAIVHPPELGETLRNAAKEYRRRVVSR